MRREPGPTTTTTTVVPGTGGVEAPSSGAPKTGGKSGAVVRPTAGSDRYNSPRGTSLWSQGFHSKAALREAWYLDADDNPMPLYGRLAGWRTQFVQTGNADLQSVLDYELRGGGGIGNRNQPTEGVGSREANVAKMRPAGRTVSWWLEFMRKAKPEDLAKYQQILFQSGYMNPDVYKQPSLLMTGVYDEFTQDAWQHLIKDAVMTGDTTIEATLKRQQDAIAAMGGLSAYIGAQNADERDPFTAVVTAPEDIRLVGEQVSQDLVGRGDANFAQSLVGGYQAEETRAQRSQYDQVETGGTTVANPDLSAYAADQLKRRNPTEVGAYAGLGAFNTILQDLGLAG